MPIQRTTESTAPTNGDAAVRAKALPISKDAHMLAAQIADQGLDWGDDAQALKELCDEVGLPWLEYLKGHAGEDAVELVRQQVKGAVLLLAKRHHWKERPYQRGQTATLVNWMVAFWLTHRGVDKALALEPLYEQYDPRRA